MLAAYGQRMLTRIATKGSRIADRPEMEMTPFARLTAAVSTAGIPLLGILPPTLTQDASNSSLGAKAYAMLARSGWPRVELT